MKLCPKRLIRLLPAIMLGASLLPFASAAELSPLLPLGPMLVQTDEALLPDEPLQSEDTLPTDEPLQSDETLPTDEPLQADETLQTDEPLQSNELFPLSSPLQPDEPDTEAAQDTVDTEEALLDWLDAHLKTGGRVTLSADVTITASSYFPAYEPIVIDTGAHSLIYDGGHLLFDGAEIIGEGVDGPVLDVLDVGGGRYPYHWVNAVQSLRITASGRDGVGGVAIRVGCDGSASLDRSALQQEGNIRAYGEGAIGLLLTQAQNKVFCLNVTVEGANSTAVYAEAGATLSYCKLSASGAGATAIAGEGDLKLDTCVATPVSAAVEQDFYHITGVIGRSFYLPVQQYSDNAVYTDDRYTFTLQNADGSATRRETFSVLWSKDPETLSRDTLGKQELPGKLSPAFEGLGLTDDFDLTLNVEIRDASIPCISAVSINFDLTSSYAILDFWQAYDPAVDSVILWRSNDGGESWYDFTSSKLLTWDGKYLFFDFGEIYEPITLQLEVPGVGESNLATLYAQDGAVQGGLGGDRVGTDRVTQGGIGSPGTKPPETPNPPDPPRGSNNRPDRTDNPPKTLPEKEPDPTENPVTPPIDENTMPPVDPPQQDGANQTEVDLLPAPEAHPELPSTTPPTAAVPSLPVSSVAPPKPNEPTLSVPPVRTDDSAVTPTEADTPPAVSTTPDNEPVPTADEKSEGRSTLRTALTACCGGALFLLAFSHYWKRRP